MTGILDLLGPASLLSSRSLQGDSDMGCRAIWLAMLLSSLPIAGCGTVANLARPGPVEGGKTPFGGVRQDVSCMEKAANGPCDCRTDPKSSEQHSQVPLMLLCAVDLPFSLFGDVVTWPYTAAYSWINQPVPVPPVTQAPPGTTVPQAPAESRANSYP
jgi:uncharacterized protein YceK